VNSEKGEAMPRLFCFCPKGQVENYVAVHHLLSNRQHSAPTEYDMSKRLTTSAIIATLLMMATTFYSTAQLDRQESASRTVLMGG
jgi:hypothetical protein